MENSRQRGNRIVLLEAYIRPFMQGFLDVSIPLRK